MSSITCIHAYPSTNSDFWRQRNHLMKRYMALKPDQINILEYIIFSSSLLILNDLLNKINAAMGVPSSNKIENLKPFQDADQPLVHGSVSELAPPLKDHMTHIKQPPTRAELCLSRWLLPKSLINMREILKGPMGHWAKIYTTHGQCGMILNDLANRLEP